MFRGVVLMVLPAGVVLLVVVKVSDEVDVVVVDSGSLLLVQAMHESKTVQISRTRVVKDFMAVNFKCGIIGGALDMEIVTLVFQDTVKLSTNLRSLTRFDVKDWATWEKNFKDGEQERINNGITVRGYGHEAGNNEKVRIVTAILDTAKAYAYWKSDMLKKRREAGGVISEVDRFVHQVVQRY